MKLSAVSVSTVPSRCVASTVCGGSGGARRPNRNPNPNPNPNPSPNPSPHPNQELCEANGISYDSATAKCGTAPCKDEPGKHQTP